MLRTLLASLFLIPHLAASEGETPGEFDYWVLALSWSPGWCAREGDERASPQCDTGTGFGWILHGLWPQYQQGWPSWCPTVERPPSRRQTAAMADIMGTSGLAWHQWRKHGTCTGLSPDDYYALSREAYGRITRPGILRRVTGPTRLPASVIEEAFVEANPELFADAITVTCAAGRISDVRLCLSRDDLSFVACGADIIRDCTLTDALLDPVR